MIPRLARDHLGEGFVQRSFDTIDDGADVCHDLARPKANNAKIVASQPSCAARIMRRLPVIAVLAAVHLDHQPRGEADKVHKIRSQRKLATKPQAIELLSFQEMPKSLFCVRGSST
jgi:hypothetical protein